MKRPRWIISAAILAVISEAVLWALNQSYGKLMDNTNFLGIVAFVFHCPGMMIAGLYGLSSPDLSAEAPMYSGGFSLF